METMETNDTLRAAWNETCLRAGLPSISSDTSARIMAVLHVESGCTTAVTHSPKLRADLKYIQRRFGLFGGATPDAAFVQTFRRYVREIGVGAPPLPGFVQRQPHSCIRMTYGYIRVSSDKQTVENQRFEIKNFCKRQNMKVDGWIEETISGTKNYSKRRLGVLLKKVSKGDMIICSELSRLGRSLFMIMDILNICMNKECQVWTIKDNYRLGDDISSKVLAFAFGLSAEIERNLISQRTKEALARKKAEGVVLGRPKGRKTAPEKHKLYHKRQLIVSLLNEGISKRRISVIVKVDRGTLRRYINANDLRPTVPSPTRADRISVQIITNAIAAKHEPQ